jgi:hypothetical protein
MDDKGRIRMAGLERLPAILVTAFGLLVSVFIGLYAVGFGGNPLTSLMLITAGFLLVISTINPRKGLLLLILSGACLDFLKRFLVIFGIGSMSDVLGVLAVAPINLTGVFLGTCVLRPIFTKQMLDKHERRLVYLSLFLITASLASGIRGDRGLSVAVIGNAANQSAYSLLVPVICILYRRTGIDGLKRLLQYVTFIFLPVALYGIHQFVFGFAQFEVDYLRAGFSSLGDILYEAHPRPFSMLNSNHAFAVSMGVAVLISGMLCVGRLRNRAGFFSSKWRWIFPAIFAIACLLSFGRAGWMIPIIGFICMFAFRTRTRVLAFYSIFALGFGVFVWQADAIYASLDKLQAVLPSGSTFQEQAFRLGTYSERLYGFQNVFRNQSMWTWFGNPDLAYRAGERLGEGEIVHDALGQLLISHGILGLMVLAVAGGLSLFLLHRKILAIPRGPNEILGRGLLSVAIAVFFGGMLTGSHLSVFPINLLFWTTAGALVAVVMMKAPSLVEKNFASVAATSGLKAGPQLSPTRSGTGVAGFRPST